MASTKRSSTTVCYVAALEQRIYRCPLRGDASRRAGGELQIDRAATTRAEDPERGRRTFSKTFAGIHRWKTHWCRVGCGWRYGASRTSLSQRGGCQCTLRGVKMCRVWLVGMSRTGTRLRAMHDRACRVVLQAIGKHHATVAYRTRMGILESMSHK